MQNDKTMVWEGKSEERVIEEGSNDAESVSPSRNMRPHAASSPNDSRSAIQLQELNGQVAPVGTGLQRDAAETAAFASEGHLQNMPISEGYRPLAGGMYN